MSRFFTTGGNTTLLAHMPCANNLEETFLIRDHVLLRAVINVQLLILAIVLITLSVCVLKALQSNIWSNVVAKLNLKLNTKDISDAHNININIDRFESCCCHQQPG